MDNISIRHPETAQYIQDNMKQVCKKGKTIRWRSTLFRTVCSCHVTYTFQSEFTLYRCLNVKELLGRSRHEIWRLSDCNWTRTQNHLVLKWTLSHLAILAKWLSCVLSTYLYSAFDSTFGAFVWVQLQSLNFQISRLLWARNSLTSRQL